MTGGIAFDVQAVCAGFVCALSVADSMVRSGAADTALIVGAETYSRILDWDDRQTCVLFGDGAGAAVLRADTGAGTTADRGVLCGPPCVPMGAITRRSTWTAVSPPPRPPVTLRMQGREVFRHAVANLAEIAGEALDAAGVGAGDVDWLVPHQANRRIIDATGQEARNSCGEDHRDRGPPRQYLVCLHPARAQGRHRRRADYGRAICWLSRRSAAAWSGAPASFVSKTAVPA